MDLWSPGAYRREEKIKRWNADLKAAKPLYDVVMAIHVTSAC